MDLKIVKIVDHKKASTERILLRATADTNLYSFAICDNTYISGTEQLSNERRNFYWFPDLDVQEGEYVRLWTKSGNYRKHIPDGADDFYHELYWGLSGGVWNNSGDLAVLFEINRMFIHVVKPAF